jgi:hypothetical protein
MLFYERYVFSAIYSTSLSPLARITDYSASAHCPAMAVCKSKEGNLEHRILNLKKRHCLLFYIYSVIDVLAGPRIDD